MKLLFLINLFIVAFAGSALSQGNCSTNGNPSVPQPTQVSVVSSTCSTLVVRWQGTANQTYCVSATYFNTTANRKDTVSGTPTCDAAQSCTATLSVIPVAQVAWSVQAIGNGSASYPVINVLEGPVPPCASAGSSISFCGKVLLQGAYDTLSKQMRTSLNSLGILDSLARHQPYNTAPFNYPGLDSVSTGFFAAHPDIVDWVLLEIRDPNAPLYILAQRVAFVKKDGTLVDTSGTNTRITFTGVAPARYHVAIRHRNHLGIRTSTPVDFTCSNPCYDFTTSGFRSFKSQSYTSPAQMGSVWVMRGGNANANLNTRFAGPANDANQILNGKLDGFLSRVINNVYAPEDVNMDGTIRWTGPGNDQNFLLNMVLSGFLSTVWNEQL